MLTALLTPLALAALPACGSIDLDTALALSLRASDEVVIRQAEVAAARADEALAHALRWFPSATATIVTGPAPEARGNILTSPNTNRSLAGIRPFGRVDVNVVQPLYTFGRLEAASEAAAAGVRAREDLVQDTQSQVQLRVVQLFWGISLAEKLLALAVEVEKSLEEAEHHIEESLAAGKGDVVLSDRYRVALFRAVLESRKVEAQRGLEQARIGLAASIGLSPSALVLKDTPLEPKEAPLPDAAAALAAAEERRPDLLALDQAIAARDAEIKAERAAQKPQFFLTGIFGYAYAPNRDIQLNPWVHDDFNFLAVGAAIGFRQDLAVPMLVARVEKASAEKATLERQRAGLARLVQVQVDGAMVDLRGAADKLVKTRAALGAGRSLFRSSGLDFSAGVLEARNLIEAYALYVESQINFAQAEFEIEVARARFAQATGERPKGELRCEVR